MSFEISIIEAAQMVGFPASGHQPTPQAEALVAALDNGTYEPPETIRPIFKQVAKVAAGVGAVCLAAGISVGAYRLFTYDRPAAPSSECHLTDNPHNPHQPYSLAQQLLDC